MKPKFFIRLNLILTLVFFVSFVIILFFVDPFDSGRLVIVVFYLVLFGLILGILNFILKTPFWVRILIALTVVILLILKKGKF